MNKVNESPTGGNSTPRRGLPVSPPRWLGVSAFVGTGMLACAYSLFGPATVDTMGELARDGERLVAGDVRVAAGAAGICALGAAHDLWQARRPSQDKALLLGLPATLLGIACAVVGLLLVTVSVPGQVPWRPLRIVAGSALLVLGLAAVWCGGHYSERGSFGER